MTVHKVERHVWNGFSLQQIWEKMLNGGSVLSLWNKKGVACQSCLVIGGGFHQPHSAATTTGHPK